VASENERAKNLKNITEERFRIEKTEELKRNKKSLVKID